MTDLFQNQNQNNVAAGMGQILLLAGQFWPAGRLLPPTGVGDISNTIVHKWPAF